MGEGVWMGGGGGGEGAGTATDEVAVQEAELSRLEMLL